MPTGLALWTARRGARPATAARAPPFMDTGALLPLRLRPVRPAAL